MAPALTTIRPDGPANTTTRPHMSGLTYGAFGHSLVKDEYNKNNVGPGGPDIDYDNAELVKRVAQLPLAGGQAGPHAEPFATDPDSKQAVRLVDVRRVPKLLAGGAGLA